MRFILFFIYTCLVVACSTPNPTKTLVPIKQPITTPDMSNYSEGMPLVYEKFDNLAYIFQQQTDTTYIINFWATWCKPCLAELPYFEKITKEYNSEKIKVILVSLDPEQQLESKLLPFIEKHQLKSEVLVLLDPDETAWMDKVDPAWSGAIPISIIYNKEKRVLFEESFEDFAALEQVIQPFLK